MNTNAQRSPGNEFGAHQLRRSLRPTDIFLMQVLGVLSSSWIAYAAAGGHAHTTIWLVSTIAFGLPLALVVSYLVSRMPSEGGPYAWTRRAFGDLAGFVVAANMWLFGVAANSMVGLQIVGFFEHAFGLGVAGIFHGQMKQMPSAIACVLVTVALAFAALRGLRIAKWVHNMGGATLFLAYAIMLVLPYLCRAPEANAVRQSAAEFIPQPTSHSLNIVAKLGLGAFCGLECGAVFAAESDASPRDIARSTVAAVLTVGLLYILGTFATLALVQRESLDMSILMAQVIEAGLSDLGLGVAKPIVFAVITLCLLSSSSVMFNAASRMPMVVGWDALLPSWLGNTDAKTGAPRNAVLLVATVTIGLGFFGLAGDNRIEGFQFLLDTTMIFYIPTYLALFAIPLFGARAFGERPPTWLRIAAGSGMGMTVLYASFAVIPIRDIARPLGFPLEVAGCFIVANVITLIPYIRRKRHSRIVADSQSRT